jgi:hypothetical protein
MWIDTSHPANALLLRHYELHEGPVIAPPGSVSDPYLNCGSHPDVVERVWDQLGSVLSTEARCLVAGTPALVLPNSGVVAALGYGTQYCIRVPLGSIAEALASGASTVQRWTTGGQTDIQTELGQDWVFGSYSKQELLWCELVALQYEFGITTRS